MTVGPWVLGMGSDVVSLDCSWNVSCGLIGSSY